MRILKINNLKKSTKRYLVIILVLVILLSAFLIVSAEYRKVKTKDIIDNLFFNYILAHTEQNIHRMASVFYPYNSEEYNHFIARNDYFEIRNDIFREINNYDIYNVRIGAKSAKAQVSIVFYHYKYNITYDLSFIKIDDNWYLKNDLEDMSHHYNFDNENNHDDNGGDNGGYYPSPPNVPSLVIEDKSIAQYTIKSNERIDHMTFCDFNNLNRVIFPADYYFIDPQWFNSCPNLISIEVSPDCNKYYSEDGVVYSKNKEQLICYPVGKIQNKNSSNGVYVMPDTVKSVMEYSFFRTAGLKKVCLSKNLKDIGAYAFSDSKNLEEVITNETLEKIGSFAFKNCEKLKSFLLPDSVTIIGKEAFRNCSSLKSFTISSDSNLKSMGHSVFENCKQLETILIPPEITKINHWTFTDCISLKEINLPSEITEIGLFAFKNCVSLQNLYISQNIVSVNRGAFYNCNSLSLKVYFNSAPTAWNSAWDDNFDNIEWNCRI